LPRGKIVFLFLVRAVVAGVGQAWHVEFDRVAAFVAAGRKATKDETAKNQNKAAHLSSPGLARRRNNSLPAIAAPVKHAKTAISSPSIAHGRYLYKDKH
jgi:hypothetical protein